MNILLLDVMLLFCIEIIEANFQKGRTVTELVENLKRLRDGNFLGFLLLHSSTIFIVGYIFVYDVFNLWIAVIIFLKLSDLVLKFKIFATIDQHGRFSSLEFFGVDDFEVTNSIRYTGAFVYSLLFLAGVSA